MGIKEHYIRDNTKNVILELQVNNFSDVGYWIRTIKQKFKDFGVLKIRLKVDIDYFDDGTRKNNKYTEEIKKWK